MKKLAALLVLFSIFGFGQKQSLKKEISNLTKGKNATVAVAVKGIDFPFEFNNENAEKKLPMLSVYKFHIAATVLKFVDDGKFTLDQKILVKKSDLLENTWSPIREKFPEGNVELTLTDVIKYTVAQSDNNGCDILLRLLGGEKKVQDFMDSKNVKNFQILYNEEMMHKGAEYVYPNHSTAKSMTNLLKDFYLGKILSKKSTDFLMETMSGTTTGTNKIKEQLPKNSVAHKTGSSGTDDQGFTIAENDAGIVTLPNGKHYAITVFVSDSREKPETNTKLISNISKAVYDFLKK